MRKGIYKYNSLTVMFVFTGIAVITALNSDQITVCMSYAAALAVSFLYEGAQKAVKKLSACITFSLFFAVLNPLISHNGNTVLFYIFGLKYTLEAMIYGAFFAVMMSGVMMWMNNINTILTPDSMIQVFGRFFSKIALVLSISFSALPMYVRHAKEYSACTRTLGLNTSSEFSKMKGVKRVFSALIYTMPEVIIDKSLNMNCRGFGYGKYRCFIRRRIKPRDIAVMLLYAAIFVFCFTAHAAKGSYYPSFAIESVNIIPLAVTALMMLLPIIA